MRRQTISGEKDKEGGREEAGREGLQVPVLMMILTCVLGPLHVRVSVATLVCGHVESFPESCCHVPEMSRSGMLQTRIFCQRRRWVSCSYSSSLKPNFSGVLPCILLPSLSLVQVYRE